VRTFLALGRQLDFGVASLEGKIIQQAVVTILNQIYKVDFNGFLSWLRPGHGPDLARDAARVGIQGKQVNWAQETNEAGPMDVESASRQLDASRQAGSQIDAKPVLRPSGGSIKKRARSGSLMSELPFHSGMVGST